MPFQSPVSVFVGVVVAAAALLVLAHRAPFKSFALAQLSASALLLLTPALALALSSTALTLGLLTAAAPLTASVSASSRYLCAQSGIRSVRSGRVVALVSVVR